MTTDIERLRASLRARLTEPARAWLEESLALAADAAAGPGGSAAERPHRPAAWEARFAAAGRHCGRKALADTPADPVPEASEPAATPADPAATDISEPADTARVLLLHAARADASTAERLYAHGSGAERRAVLLALPHLGIGAEALPLVEDALRANDTRLVAAAVGPYGAQHLDPHGWRHAVLKCLFTEVPVTAVAGLGQRARGDAELARMLADYARERTAAGRAVPEDLSRVLALATGNPLPEES